MTYPKVPSTYEADLSIIEDAYLAIQTSVVDALLQYISIGSLPDGWSLTTVDPFVITNGSFVFSVTGSNSMEIDLISSYSYGGLTIDDALIKITTDDTNDEKHLSTFTVTSDSIDTITFSVIFHFDDDDDELSGVTGTAIINGTTYDITESF